MGQIILYNVVFAKPPAAAVEVFVYYRREDIFIYTFLGKFLANPDGKFVTPVTIPTDDDRWYVVKVEVGCMPCFTEKRIYGSNATTTVPCCAPEILEVTIQTASKPAIEWVGIDPVCLKDISNYNTGVKRFVNRARYVDGAPDGYVEPNAPGENFVPDETDLTMCPLPVITWAGLNPVCLTDGLGYNIGIKHYMRRARLVTGVPDGYQEDNVQDVNYVADEQDLVNCPVPKYTWSGSNDYCVVNHETGYNTGYLAYQTRDRMVNGVPDGYRETNSQGANYIPPVYNPQVCTLPVYTWQGDNPVCLKGSDNLNTGMVRFQTRVRTVNGVPDGYTEPNAPDANFVPDRLDLDFCPVPVVTWVGLSPYCVKDGFGVNTGMQGYQQRGRIVDGSPDGHVEDNIADEKFVAPVQNLVDCPLPATTTVPPPPTTIPPATTTLPVITWVGSAPYCQQQPACQAGFVLSADGTTCTREETQAPTISATDYCLAGSGSTEYGPYFSRIYNPGFAPSSIYVFTPPAADVFAEMGAVPQWKNPGNATQGPNNRCSVWIDSNCDGVKDPLTGGAKTTLSAQYTNMGAERTIYVGVFGDNQFELKVNENTIINANMGGDMPFRVFHIFPVTLAAGTNYFNVVGTGDGSTNDAIGMIIYDNTPEQIRDAVSDSTLNILFSSFSLIGQHIQIATCPTGWILDTSVPTAYVCKRITREDSHLVNTTIKLFASRDRYVNGVFDGYTEPNTAGPNYVNGVVDAASCPITEP